MALDEHVGDGLNAWVAAVNASIAAKRQALMLRTKPGDVESREKIQGNFQAAAEAVSQTERHAAELSSCISAEDAEQPRLAALRKRAQQQLDRLASIRSRLPPEVSALLDTHIAGSAVANGNSSASGLNDIVPHTDVHEAAVMEPSRTKTKQRPGVQGRLQRKPSADENAGGRQKGSLRTNTQRSQPERPITRGAMEKDSGIAVGSAVPAIRRVSEEELRAAPQYVKGRLTVAKIDSVVDKLDEAIQSKYRLLAKPRRELTSSEIDHVVMFGDSECADTAGATFISDAELKNFAAFKMDATARSAINVLRHVGSMKEIRGKNKARVFIVR